MQAHTLMYNMRLIRLTNHINNAQVGKGDLVTFPEGMGCTWEVHEAIKKHYKFH